MRSVYILGYKACRHGVPRIKCPYANSTPKAKTWKEGYDDARKNNPRKYNLEGFDLGTTVNPHSPKPAGVLKVAKPVATLKRPRGSSKAL
jgi:ribosome modulation factor